MSALPMSLSPLQQVEEARKRYETAKVEYDHAERELRSKLLYLADVTRIISPEDVANLIGNLSGRGNGLEAVKSYIKLYGPSTYSAVDEHLRSRNYHLDAFGSPKKNAIYTTVLSGVRSGHLTLNGKNALGEGATVSPADVLGLADPNDPEIVAYREAYSQKQGLKISEGLKKKLP